MNFNKELDDVLGTVPMTYVGIVLDKSGSMQSIANEVVGGFNTQLESFIEKDKTTPIKLSVVTFADNTEFIMWNKKPSEATKLDNQTYVPNGMTALCDAVGSLITRYEVVAKEDKEASFLIVILSDGAENASQTYRTHQIKEMIEKNTETGMWTFVYQGANQDMWAVAQNFGLSAGNTMAFTASVSGMSGTSGASGVSGRSYDAYFAARSMGQTATKAFYDNSTSLISPVSPHKIINTNDSVNILQDEK